MKLVRLADLHFETAFLSISGLSRAMVGLRSPAVYAALAMCSAMLGPLPAIAEETCSRFDVTPARYEDEQFTLIYEAHDFISIIPAVYRDSVRETVDTPSHCPGTTFTVRRQRVYLDTEDRLVIVPPTFKLAESDGDVRRYVVDKPVSVGRVPANGYPPSIMAKVVDHLTECSPQEMIPAQTRTVPSRVIDKPASARRQRIPERTRTITERVIVEPALIKIREVPC